MNEQAVSLVVPLAAVPDHGIMECLDVMHSPYSFLSLMPTV